LKGLFDIEIWQEIFVMIRKNKLRTFLTGFSVAWGIFMLIILLGSGNGLQNKILHDFSDATNAVWVWSGQTSKPYKGLPPGRRITYKNDDYEMLSRKAKKVHHLSGRFWAGGQALISYKNEYGDFHVQSIHPAHQYIEDVKITNGRRLNKFDQDEVKKVAIIGKLVKEAFFKQEDPLGKYISIKNIPFKVVGIFEDIHDGEMERVYIPISAAQRIFARGENIGIITYTVGDASVEESERIVKNVHQMLADKHKVSMEDNRAIGMWNARKEMQNFLNLFTGIRIFIWIVGIGTLIAGTVGVSNIMLIVVKERTKEIGIRKALGAKPGSIIKLVLLEAITVMALFGYVGMTFGVILLELVARNMPENDFIMNPGVDLRVALSALALILIAGSLAGYIPSRKASRIKPIVALHDE